MWNFNARMAQIRPFLFLGAATHEKDFAELQEASVSHVLQVGSELSPSHPHCFQYLRIAIDDAEQEDIVRQLPRCFKFIEEARKQGGSVLVHCMAGMSRSASVVVSYLMWAEGLPYDAAFGHAKQARPCIYPNLGFLLQLWEWEARGRDFEAWPGWGRARFVERLAAYRRAQTAAGMHPALRKRLSLAAPLPVEGLGAEEAGDGMTSEAVAAAVAAASVVAAVPGSGLSGSPLDRRASITAVRC